MVLQIVKSLLPDRERPLRILRGPFRGARVVMNPRSSLRKVFGIYERELNPWLGLVLPRVSCVLDVGANDGYFTFGCAAAFRRLRKPGQIFAFEPQQRHADQLRAGIAEQRAHGAAIEVVPALVGREDGAGVVSLDSPTWQHEALARDNALIKIDVEGAELDVLQGALSWLRASNYFLVEVHHHSLHEPIAELFRRHSLRLTHIRQTPSSLIGRELRDENNSWMLTGLPGAPPSV